jgi:hypothetical protein
VMISLRAAEWRALVRSIQAGELDP